MRVINLNNKGEEIDLSKITIPESNTSYDICRTVYLRGEKDDRENHKDTVQEIKTEK